MKILYILLAVCASIIVSLDTLKVFEFNKVLVLFSFIYICLFVAYTIYSKRKNEKI